MPPSATTELYGADGRLKRAKLNRFSDLVALSGGNVAATHDHGKCAQRAQGVLDINYGASDSRQTGLPNRTRHPSRSDLVCANS
jgi:hypothetical protein